MASPLPYATGTNLSDLLFGEHALSAYSICLTLERNATKTEDLIHARILGYLILHAPSEIARVEVAKAIHSCAQDEQKLLTLGECFRLWYIIPFKNSNSQTTAPSDHPSRPSFDRLKEDLKVVTKEAPKDHRQAKAQALIRDGYKCVLTGMYDRVIWGDMDIPRGAFLVNTECAHIIPESTYFNASDPGDKKEYAALVSAVLKHFGYDVDKVNGPKVHSLYNVMTMEKNAHDMFDRLRLWFESTGVENRYRLQSDIPLQYLIHIPAEVTLASSDPENLPLPSAQFLALHAACAKVAHQSGAGKYIDKLDCDADDLDVLAPDGSSHDILAHMLGKVALTADTVA